MKTSGILAALLLGIMILCPPVACAEEQTFTGFRVKHVQTETLADGITYSKYTLLSPDGNPRHGQKVNVLEVSRGARSGVRLLAVNSSVNIYKALKPLGTILKRVREEIDDEILAAVNGDFFDISSGGSVGYLKTEDQWMVAGEFPEGWAVGMTSDGEPLIGQPKVSITLTLPDGTELPINALNGLRADTPWRETGPANVRETRRDNQLVLFTPAYGSKTHIFGGGTEVSLMPDGELTGEEALTAVVEKVYKNLKNGGTSLKDGRMVLSAYGDAETALRALKAGDAVVIRLTAGPPFDQSMIAIGGGRPDGGPLLMREGRPAEIVQAEDDPEVGEQFYRHHPRTVFAVREDGSYFLLAVEGNNDDAFGMTLEQTQAVLKDLGAYTAVNLDGGPSTTMAVRQGEKLKVVTNTTGVKDRQTPVGSALILVRTE